MGKEDLFVLISNISPLGLPFIIIEKDIDDKHPSIHNFHLEFICFLSWLVSCFKPTSSYLHSFSSCNQLFQFNQCYFRGFSDFQLFLWFSLQKDTLAPKFECWQSFGAQRMWFWVCIGKEFLIEFSEFVWVKQTTFCMT